MKAVIFDFDGTIADSFQYVYDFLCKEARVSGSQAEAAALQYRGMSMKAMALKLGIPFWRLPFLYFKGRRVMRQHLTDVQPFGGMLEVVKTLHKQGNELFIVSSNSSRNVRTFLRQNQLNDCFRGIRGGAGIMGKVSIVRQVLVRYRLSKANCWYVGDELGDMVAAKAVGIHAVAVSWGFADAETLREMADMAVSRPEELLEVLR